VTKSADSIKLKNFKKRFHKEFPFVVLVLPFVVFFVIFTLIPIVSAIALSFTDYNLLQINNFVGFKNYIRIFLEDDIFMIAFKNTMILALVTGPIGFILSFVISWLINELGRFSRSIVTLIVYSPALVGNVYFIWKYIFSADSRGFLNNVLMQIGLVNDPISWLTDEKYNFAIVMIVTVWMSFGTGFLSFVSGLKALDRSYYEAAAVDGLKNRWQELYYVTFPQMGPQLMFGAVMSISGAFAVGAVNSELTGFPSSNYATHTILLYMNDFANNRYEMGYASAVAVVLFALMIAFKAIVNKVLAKFNG
jgi:multiple sugar transport system permease protein